MNATKFNAEIKRAARSIRSLPPNLRQSTTDALVETFVARGDSVFELLTMFNPVTVASVLKEASKSRTVLSHEALTDLAETCLRAAINGESEKSVATAAE